MESTILFIGEKHFAGTASGSVIFCLRKKTVIGKIYAMQLIFCQLLKVHRHVSLSKQRLLLQNDGPTEKATYRWLVTCPLNEKEKITEIELYLI